MKTELGELRVKSNCINLMEMLWFSVAMYTLVKAKANPNLRWTIQLQHACWSFGQS